MKWGKPYKSATNNTKEPGVAEGKALKAAMEQKARDLLEKGAEIYTMA